jgi:hypothetical protein
VKAPDTARRPIGGGKNVLAPLHETSNYCETVEMAALNIERLKKGKDLSVGYVACWPRIQLLKNTTALENLRGCGV